MTDFLQYGPKVESSIPLTSMGKVVFQQLKGRDPNGIAAVDAYTDQAITYGELLAESIKVAVALRNIGIKEGDRVSIISENTTRYCIPYIATLYLGAVICPVNPTYTPRELIHAWSLTNPKVVFTSKISLKSVLDVKSQVDYIQTVVVYGEAVDGTVSYQEFLAVNDSEVEAFEPVDVDMDSLQAVLLSSGTMGFPKGVMLSHRNLRVTFQYLSEKDYAGLTEGEAIVGVVPCFHVFGLFSQLAAITFATKVVVMAAFKPDVFLKSIQQHKVTRLFVVPAMAMFLAKHPIVASFDLSSLKEIYCAAAPLGHDIQTLLQNRLGVVRQSYGLTELCGSATAQEKGSSKPGTAGKLIPGLIAKIIDLDTGKALGAHQNGELCFKGPMVMKGYIGDEESTKATIDEEGFLHSGDVGYYDDDGDFFIVDRLKELIKYKGFQVPPAELEDILASHPAVKEVGVVGKADERAGEVPVAFIVKQQDASITEQELIDFVAERVSEQKRLYGGVRFVEELPKTQSGKILRRKLRELL